MRDSREIISAQSIPHTVVVIIGRFLNLAIWWFSERLTS